MKLFGAMLALAIVASGEFNAQRNMFFFVVLIGFFFVSVPIRFAFQSARPG